MAFSITGNLTLGSSAISSVSSTTGIAVGMLIDNANVVAGTVVSAIDAGAAVITMSAPATATAAGETLEFVSSFATAVTATVTVGAAPLILDPAAFEVDATVTVIGAADLNSGQSQQLATSVSVSVTATADLATGRNEILETAGAIIAVTATADLTDQNVALEGDVAVSVTASADLDLAGRTLFDAIELYLDVSSRQLVTLRAGHASVAARKVVLKRNDRPLVRLRFVRDDQICDIPDGTIVALGGKKRGNYGGSMVFHSSAMVRYLDADRLPYYEEALNLATPAVESLFTADTIQKVDCVGEVELSTPSFSAVSSSQEFPVELWNDVVRGAPQELAGSVVATVEVEADLTIA
jgi:hypothetical protein